jgi:hypothetical protein
MYELSTKITGTTKVRTKYEQGTNFEDRQKTGKGKGESKSERKQLAAVPFAWLAGLPVP